MQRAVLTGVLPPDICRELIWAARSLAVVGYRDCVASATIFDVASAAPALLMPLVAAREAVRAAAEAALGLELGLLVEFTGLLCWRPGASIGWHHDANRPYLRQRCASAVCYLNAAGADFQGGTFLFGDSHESCRGWCGSGGGGAGRGGGCSGCRSGGCGKGCCGGSSRRGGSLFASGGEPVPPLEVHAAPGTLVAYGAHVQHRVRPVTAGERYALTLWLTEDPQHDEDARLLAVLTGPVERPAAPLPASMWLLPDGTDLRLCRVAMAGFALAWRGRLLRSAAELEDAAEADAGAAAGGGGAANSVGAGQKRAASAVQPVPLQLAVQPAALRAWREWQAAPEPRCWELGGAPAAAGTAGGGGTAAAPVDFQPAAPNVPAELVAGLEFSSVQEAVLALEHWVWRHGGAASGTRERPSPTSHESLGREMERLAAGAAHKRKGGALEQLGGASGGRRSGHASAAEATAAAAVAEAAAAAGAEAQQGELTDRSEMHLLNLRETQRELTNQIDAITGLQVLDNVRASFLERMARVKGEVGDLLAQTEGMLRTESTATLDFRKRAANAGRLIDILNLRTADVEQRPETLFSAAQEPGAADEGEGEGGDE
ncbi:prolyl 3-hydroxylase 1 isoform X3 [Micractinium conductrix]|uniref:Prolyl 3-hydroxylase 1 isoform X3 n=1 Tax=Micractinium conductrix TaxID=554055 RepID=A0A2P6VQ09_9CHLO|nr:prolyl 3-hydroxylase 1 isoform X3 [Micractinium conductrix]|eukprot:PSC76160.1 prolyl 3-hydroxylase 1 isoform X3 [Micractinium conductrix]